MSELLNLLHDAGLNANLNPSFPNLIEVDIEDEVLQVWQTNAPYERPRFEITDTQDTIKMVCRTPESVVNHLDIWNAVEC